MVFLAIVQCERVWMGPWLKIWCLARYYTSIMVDIVRAVYKNVREKRSSVEGYHADCLRWLKR